MRRPIHPPQTNTKLNLGWSGPIRTKKKWHAGFVWANYLTICDLGNQIKYKLKGDKKVSRFGDSPDQEIHTEKLVGGMSPPWEQRLGQGGRMNPNFKGQYVSVTKGILENLLKKKDGKYTPLACEFLKDVRMVVIDEADKLWSNGGIQGLEKNFLVPICAARNQGKKANTKQS